MILINFINLSIIGFQSPATTVMEAIVSMHHYVFFYLILVFIFVIYMYIHILYDYQFIPSYLYDISHKFNDETILFIKFIRLFIQLFLNFEFFSSYIIYFSQRQAIRFLLRDELYEMIQAQQYPVMLPYRQFPYISDIIDMSEIIFTYRVKNNNEQNNISLELADLQQIERNEIEENYNLVFQFYQHIPLIIETAAYRRQEQILITRLINHNSNLEIIQTLIPSFFLFLIALPSFALLYEFDEILAAAMTFKVIGYQQFQTYEVLDLYLNDIKITNLKDILIQLETKKINTLSEPIKNELLNKIISSHNELVYDLNLNLFNFNSNFILNNFFNNEYKVMLDNNLLLFFYEEMNIVNNDQKDALLDEDILNLLDTDIDININEYKNILDNKLLNFFNDDFNIDLNQYKDILNMSLSKFLNNDFDINNNMSLMESFENIINIPLELDLIFQILLIKFDMEILQDNNNLIINENIIDEEILSNAFQELYENYTKEENNINMILTEGLDYSLEHFLKYSDLHSLFKEVINIYINLFDQKEDFFENYLKIKFLTDSPEKTYNFVIKFNIILNNILKDHLSFFLDNFLFNLNLEDNIDLLQENNIDVQQNINVFDSVMIPEESLQKGQKRLLEVDNPLILPFNYIIQAIITAGDVLHSQAIPAFGIKIDAVPGRLNQVQFLITRPGTFYGQCSELCGVNHGFMPIVIKVPFITITDK